MAIGLAVVYGGVRIYRHFEKSSRGRAGKVTAAPVPSEIASSAPPAFQLMREAKRGVRVVFVGDSITMGVYLDPKFAEKYGGGGIQSSFAARLASDLPTTYPDVTWGTFVNLGQGSTTATQWNGWVGQRVAQLYPDVVVVMLGDNDCMDQYHYRTQTFAEFALAYLSLVNKLEALPNGRGGHPRLVLVSPPVTDPMHENVTGVTEANMAPYVAAMRSVADSTGATFVDVWSTWLQLRSQQGKSFVRNYVRVDGMHPSALGHSLLYSELAPAVHYAALQAPR